MIYNGDIKKGRPYEITYFRLNTRETLDIDFWGAWKQSFDKCILDKFKDEITLLEGAIGLCDSDWKKAKITKLSISEDEFDFSILLKNDCGYTVFYLSENGQLIIE